MMLGSGYYCETLAKKLSNEYVSYVKVFSALDSYIRSGTSLLAIFTPSLFGALLKRVRQSNKEGLDKDLFQYA